MPLWPETYSVTEVGLLMRAAERFGQDPARWIDGLSQGWRALVLAHELLREHEEEPRTGVPA